MASKFLSKYFPPSMVTKLRNDISNFRQFLDESLFEAWERYKLSIDRCPNHNMLPVTQIYMFYNGLTLRHRDSINAAIGGTFMKRRLKECYDLIENMTAYHNDWDTSAHRGGNAYHPQVDRNLLSYRSNNFLRPPSFNPPNNQNQGNNKNFQNSENIFNQGQGYNQNRGQNFNHGNNYNQNQGYNQNHGQNFNHGNNYNQNQGYNQNHGQNFNQAQPNVPSLEEMMLQHMRSIEAKMQQMKNHNDQQIQHLKPQNTHMANLMGQVQKALQERPQGAFPSNTIPSPREEIKVITTQSGTTLAGPPVPPSTPFSKKDEVERDPETITDHVLTESTTKVPPLLVQPSPSSRPSEIPPPPISSSSELPKRNPR
ncbi:reverse transcriptase domain-containing protein [Tanacetum coccineum]